MGETPMPLLPDPFSEVPRGLHPVDRDLKRRKLLGKMEPTTMQTPDDIVPESGQREFAYSGSRLIGIGAYSIFFGALISLVAVAALIGVSWAAANKPELVHGPVWEFWLCFGLFLAIGVGIVLLGVAYLKSVKNEKIVLTASEAIWIDRNGREKIRCGFTQIRSVKQSLVAQASSTNYAPKHYRCEATTDVGKIVFSDNIADYNRLKAFFESHAAPSA